MRDNVSIKNNLRKIKQMDLWKPTNDEKTGVLNGLILLGAALGTALSLQSHDAHAAAPTCTGDGWGNWSDWTNSWSNWGDWTNWGDWGDWCHSDWGHGEGPST